MSVRVGGRVHVCLFSIVTLLTLLLLVVNKKQLREGRTQIAPTKWQGH